MIGETNASGALLFDIVVVVLDLVAAVAVAIAGAVVAAAVVESLSLPLLSRRVASPLLLALGLESESEGKK